jgi:hypothetical protein
VAFIKDMAGGYDWADLVICRAGALTVAELAAAGVASLLVPFPHAVDDHQTSNARFLSSAGAAILLPQDRTDAGARGRDQEPVAPPAGADGRKGAGTGAARRDRRRRAGLRGAGEMRGSP